MTNACSRDDAIDPHSCQVDSCQTCENPRQPEPTNQHTYKSTPTTTTVPTEARNSQHITQNDKYLQGY